MKSYPMWFNVTNCNKKSPSSYGGKNDANTSLAVGSSSSNSHHFLKFRTTRTFEQYKSKDVCVFRFSVDGIVLKAKIFTNNNGKAGELIKTVTKLNKLKPLKL